MKDLNTPAKVIDKDTAEINDLKALIREEKQRIIFMKAADDVNTEEKHLVLLTTMSALQINWRDFVKFYESKCTVK